ncbi:MAG: KamA family radical SAM protein [Desulfoplanes sp.]|nr:KamA family radical SAM protein [Desulfoplanes sp.]
MHERVIEELDEEPPEHHKQREERTTQMTAAEDFIDAYFPGTTQEQWNDWHWQVQNRVTDAVKLDSILGLTSEEMRICTGPGNLPLAITPYYLKVIASHQNTSLRKCVVPSMWEQVISAHEDVDPLGEEGHSPVPGIVHRYPDRVLFLVTDFCSSYCRYCTRSRMVGRSKASVGSRATWEKGLEYIRNTPAVRDVLISGGDPLTMSDEKIGWLVREVRKIPHVEIVRIGTKVPAVLPQRITPALVRVLREGHPLFMSLHFTHPDELTPECKIACERLADAGIPLGSQTVLLHGINDRVDTMTRLMHGLLQCRVKPYYLYQCDPIPGSSHFRTPVSTGLEIIKGLRGHTSGYAIPSFVIDAPGGGGKIPLLPNSVRGTDEQGGLLLENYEGKIFTYPEAAGPGMNGNCPSGEIKS